MATGRLGASDVGAAVNTSVYTVPADTFSVVTVNVCNRNSNPRSIRIAVATSNSPSAAEYIEYDVVLLGQGAIERTGIVMGAGQQIVVYSDNTDISAVVYGIETATS